MAREGDPVTRQWALELRFPTEPQHRARPGQSRGGVRGGEREAVGSGSFPPTLLGSSTAEKNVPLSA